MSASKNTSNAKSNETEPREHPTMEEFKANLKNPPHGKGKKSGSTKKSTKKDTSTTEEIPNINDIPEIISKQKKSQKNKNLDSDNSINSDDIEIIEPSEEKESNTGPKNEEADAENASKARNDELQKQLLLTIADMENLRKRTQKEIQDARKYAVGNLAQDLIAVLENLRRAEESIPEEKIESDELLKNVLEGVKMTSSELLRVFERNSIKRIDPIGEKFDHNFHQALLEVPTNDQDPGTVVQVMQAGYLIHDRLLRPAMVAVAKKMPEEN